MNLLALDIGSSSIKAAILKNGSPLGEIRRTSFPTTYSDNRAEVNPALLLKALRSAIHTLGPRAKSVDAIALTVMAPSWLAMDAKGNPLTPIVTHQDRRSVDIAHVIEKRVGSARHLHLAGNRPFPGGISSTTAAWYLHNEPARLKKCDLVGHLNTYLHRLLTNTRVTDPSNASFMGLYLTLKQGGWSDELCSATGVKKSWLPDILPANQIAGRLTPSAARSLHLTPGTPILTGCMDTSAALLLTSLQPGQVINVSGTTDVLALLTDKPVPHRELLTRSLGIGNLWLSVSTLASAGSSLTWAHNQLFPDLSVKKFWSLVDKLAKSKTSTPVTFAPYLAGQRTSIDQQHGSFSNLTLSTTRTDLLHSIIESLAAASAARIPLLQQGGTKMLPSVFVSGGSQKNLSQVLHRDWPGQWTFHPHEEATLQGLGKMIPQK